MAQDLFYHNNHGSGFIFTATTMAQDLKEKISIIR
jgi:hypothetical protein